MVSIRRPTPITRPPEGRERQDNETPPRINNAPSSSASTFFGFFNSTTISSVRFLASRVFRLQGRTPFTSRKHQQSTLVMSKKWLFRVFFFFTIGSLLGLSSVFHHYIDAPHDFSFDQQSSQSLGAAHSMNDLVADPVPGSLNLATGRAIETVDEDDPVKPVQTEAVVHERGMPDQTVEPKKLLIIVTPTYNRPLQGYYLARLGQTLRLVPKQLLWIVIENGVASMETAEILRKTGVMYRHLVCMKNFTNNIKDRGVYQRNEALEHIERHRLDGIVYFADDDNIYPLELFESLREIRRFGTWPVAMLAKSKSRTILEGPVCNGSQVIGWHTNEKSKKLRRFHVDMSGFAFNSTMLWDPKRWHRPASDIIRQLDIIKEGFQETTFIEQMIEDESQMEGLPSSCSKIMIWHLHIDVGGIHPRGWKLPSNLEAVIPLS